MRKDALKGFDINAVEPTGYRYTITFVLTRNDHITEQVHTHVIRTMKARIHKHRIARGYASKYDSLGSEIVYIMDQEFFTEEGLKRLREINEEVWIDGEVLAERGIDFDIWYEYWLNDDERLEYESRNKVGDEDDEKRAEGIDEDYTGTENG